MFSTGFASSKYIFFNEMFELCADILKKKKITKLWILKKVKSCFGAFKTPQLVQWQKIQIANA